MSEYPIKCSCDGLLLYDTRLLIGMTRYGHLHMTNILHIHIYIYIYIYKSEIR